MNLTLTVPKKDPHLVIHCELHGIGLQVRLSTSVTLKPINHTLTIPSSSFQLYDPLCWGNKGKPFHNINKLIKLGGYISFHKYWNVKLLEQFTVFFLPKKCKLSPRKLFWALDKIHLFVFSTAKNPTISSTKNPSVHPGRDWEWDSSTLTSILNPHSLLPLSFNEGMSS